MASENYIRKAFEQGINKGKYEYRVAENVIFQQDYLVEFQRWLVLYLAMVWEHRV